jgi:hypothetical protein
MLKVGDLRTFENEMVDFVSIQQSAVPAILFAIDRGDNVISNKSMGYSYFMFTKL